MADQTKSSPLDVLPGASLDTESPGVKD